MTREEAIKILKELAGYEKTMDLIQNYSVSVQDALYMAIKALSSSEKLNKTDEKNTDEVLNEIIAEIREWYFDADKQEIANDPCVVDAMIDLFIRTIKKHKSECQYKAESEGK